ncbi:winged helix-turn-helix transcriptional regulator [Undibacterium sp. Ji49W]|uniref:winged helix-turn-helix transcriptional regulator n=1 Tax=Undibacterium sp. Ji49W TaxID=3413040 RepID=UPI003BF332E6
MGKAKTAVCSTGATDCTYDKRRAVADTLALIGDKWTVLVVAALSYNGVMRYNEINRQIEGISQRMLTLTLKGMEQNGLVTRTMYSTIPPRVEYALTDLGLKLVAPLRALYDWAEEYRPMMLEARDAYEERERIEAPRRAEFYAAK